MKKVIALLLLTSITFYSQAQCRLPNILFAIHGFYQAPTSSYYSSSYAAGFGPEAEVGVGLGKTTITGTAAYGYFLSRKGTGGNNYTYLPLRVGVRRKIAPKVFLDASMGSVTVNYSGGPTNKFFTAEGGIGVKLLQYEIIANYTGYNDFDRWNTGFALKFGYSFKL